MGILTGQADEALERLAAVEIIQQLKDLGIAISGLRTAAVNNVLATEAELIPSEGRFERSYPTVYRSVAISNHSAVGTITITSAPAQTDVPTRGIGVHRIGPGRSAVVNMMGNTLAVFGTPGDAVSFQIFDKTQAPSYS